MDSGRRSNRTLPIDLYLGRIDPDVDHYGVLGLPSGEEGAKLSLEEIRNAYRLKALEVHPDKRPSKDGVIACLEFSKLVHSLKFLCDVEDRKFYHERLKVQASMAASTL